MSFDFKGKVVFITGASRGIGRASALLFASSGATVVIGCLRELAAAEEVAFQARSMGAEARVLPFDVADSFECKGAIDSIIQNYGALHILVNNAGISRDSLIMRVKDEDWQRLLGVNLSSVLYLCRAASRPMIKQREGAIVNLTSIVADRGNAGQVAYAASKGGVVSLTRSLAKELGPRNIRVNAISPGWIDTDMTAGASEDMRKNVIAQISLGRTGQVEEVANAIAFLASSRASYISGHVLDVNGGM